MTALGGKTAVVTGASTGIGRAIAERYAAEGAAVALLDRDIGSAETLAADFADRGAAATATQVDVADVESVSRGFATVIARLGRIDVLVNNAAARTPAATIDELPLEEWHRALAVNLTGVFLCCREAIPHMRRAGGGAIINVASQLGQVAVAGRAAYCATKGAVIQLTRALALDHAQDGIRVNSLSPGAVLTERLTAKFGTDEDATRALAPRHPIGRLGQADEIAGGAVFLASDDASFMTGSDLVIDGGYTAQ